MATVGDALKSARSFLGDDNALTWSDSVLVPKLAEAHRELVLELELYGIPVTRVTAGPFTVTAGAKDLGLNQPADIVEPTSMLERAVGGAMDDFVSMIELPSVPELTPVSNLIYWAWEQEKIKFVGATQNREVLLKYRKSITAPVLNTAQLGFIFAELFIGPRVASLAVPPGSKEAIAFEAAARNNLEKIIQMNVVGMQSMPRRRLPYRRGRLMRGRLR